MKRILSIAICGVIGLSGLSLVGCHAEADVHDSDRDMDHTSVRTEKTTTSYPPAERKVTTETRTETVR